MVRTGMPALYSGTCVGKQMLRDPSTVLGIALMAWAQSFGLDAQEFLKMAFGIPKPCLGNPSRENERRGARSSTGCLLEEDDLGRMHGRC